MFERGDLAQFSLALQREDQIKELTPLRGTHEIADSSVERRQRRIDTSALLLLSAVYGVTQESLALRPTGKHEELSSAAWVVYYREATRRGKAPLRTQDQQAPGPRARPRR